MWEVMEGNWIDRAAPCLGLGSPSQVAPSPPHEGLCTPHNSTRPSCAEGDPQGEDTQVFPPEAGIVGGDGDDARLCQMRGPSSLMCHIPGIACFGDGSPERDPWTRPMTTLGA